jgi:hypothetical protein
MYVLILLADTTIRLNIVSDELSKTTRKWYDDKKKTCKRGWYVWDSSQKVSTIGHLGEGEIRSIAQ